MELLQLRYFFESAKTENFTQTAEKFMVPTTAVSAAIKRLEKELGCPLFDRTANRIRLNEQGKRLQQSLDVIFSELDNCTLSLSREQEDRREIKILVLSLRRIITDCIVQFKAMYPNIHFKISFDYLTESWDHYDMIIDDTADKYTQYNATVLCQARIRMKVAANSPLCEKSLTLRQLRDEPFVIMSENGRLYSILLRACKKAGFTPNIVVKANDLQCYHQFLAAGIGIGLGRDLQKEDSRQIRCLDIQDFREAQTIYCYCNPHSDYGNIRKFRDFLTQQNLQRLFQEL